MHFISVFGLDQSIKVWTHWSVKDWDVQAGWTVTDNHQLKKKKLVSSSFNFSTSEKTDKSPWVSWPPRCSHPHFWPSWKCHPGGPLRSWEWFMFSTGIIQATVEFLGESWHQEMFPIHLDDVSIAGEIYSGLRSWGTERFWDWQVYPTLTKISQFSQVVRKWCISATYRMIILGIRDPLGDHIANLRDHKKVEFGETSSVEIGSLDCPLRVQSCWQKRLRDDGQIFTVCSPNMTSFTKTVAHPSTTLTLYASLCRPISWMAWLGCGT